MCVCVRCGFNFDIAGGKTQKPNFFLNTFLPCQRISFMTWLGFFKIKFEKVTSRLEAGQLQAVYVYPTL